MRRLAVIVSAPGLAGASVPEVDGFVHRWRSLLPEIESAVDRVELFSLSWPRGDLVPRLVDRPVHRITVARPPGSRRDRARRLAMRLAPSAFATRSERAIVGAVRARGCDAAVVMGAHRTPDLVRALSFAVPTVLFAEERTPEGPDDWGLAPGVAGRVEAFALRRAMRAVRAVVVIAGHEVAWASSVFGRPVIVVPHSVDVPAPGPPVPHPAAAGTGDVFVVGNFAAARNAAGLADVLDAMARRPEPPGFRLAVASGTALHPRLLERAGSAGMRVLGAVDDPLPHYRSAVATLVPAFDVRGVKTTILQGWAAGCPVVAAAPSAASVGGTDGQDLLAGGTADELVAALERVAGDAALRARLAENGARSYEARFGARAIGASMRLALDHLERPGP
jgi:glycosyltransferase involved in cell wall biosynthesis